MWGQYYWNYRLIGKETEIHGVAKKQWKLDAEQPPDLTPEELRTVLQPSKFEKYIVKKSVEETA